MEKLYIPKTIKTGYQLRQDTYSGRLAYVVYVDGKGVLRKKGSWESWRQKPDEEKNRRWDSKLKKHVDSGEVYGERVSPQDFPNVPTEGFVINKDVGGAQRSYGWNARREKFRIYDPRDFEIEITGENLLFILEECNSIKGKGLEGEFVYSWSGADLVLLPVSSSRYKFSNEFTQLQDQKKIETKDLVVGVDYLDKNKNRYCYMGRDFLAKSEPLRDYSSGYYYDYQTSAKFSVKKEHIWWCYEDKIFKERIEAKSIVGNETNPEVSEDFNQIFEIFKKTDHGRSVQEVKLDSSNPVGFHFKDVKNNSSNYYRTYTNTEAIPSVDDNQFIVHKKKVNGQSQDWYFFYESNRLYPYLYHDYDYSKNAVRGDYKSSEVQKTDPKFVYKLSKDGQLMPIPESKYKKHLPQLFDTKPIKDPSDYPSWFSLDKCYTFDLIMEDGKTLDINKKEFNKKNKTSEY